MGFLQYKIIFREKKNKLLNIYSNELEIIFED